MELDAMARQADPAGASLRQVSDLDQTECRRFEVLTGQAANSIGDGKSKDLPRIMDLRVPMIFLKVAKAGTATDHELGTMGTCRFPAHPSLHMWSRIDPWFFDSHRQIREVV